MIIKSNGKEYFVDFLYDVNKKMTWCFIKNKNDQAVVAQAYSTVHKKDSFVKKIGRKISFTRALNIFENDKEKRKNIWGQYLNRCKV